MPRCLRILPLFLTLLSACVELEQTPEAVLSASLPGLPQESLEKKNNCYAIRINYPFLGRPAPDRQLRIWADHLLYSAAEEFEALCATAPDKRGEHTLDSGYEIFNTAATLSIASRISVYSGGAHPLENIQTINLRLNDGRELSYQDIFADTKELWTFLSDYVYAALKPSLDEIWQAHPQFTEGLEPAESSFANFVITPQGLTLFFPPYQLAPYSQGSQHCDVPLTALLRFIPKPGIWQ